MKLTVFTSNQPRHLALISTLAQVADEVFAVQECKPVFPGQSSPIQEHYFSHVLSAERRRFGSIDTLPSNVKTFSLKSGELSLLGMSLPASIFNSQHFFTFGCSFIKGPLCDYLVERKAINLHMGTSPYFRGAACNFWAMQRGLHDYVGATIHYLSSGLDSGPMLFHALPSLATADSFDLGLSAVQSGISGLAHHLKNKFDGLVPTLQDKSQEIFYSKGKDFTDEVADTYLKNLPAQKAIQAQLDSRDLGLFLKPYLLAR